MLGTIVNSCAIIIGSSIGICLQKGVSIRVKTVLFQVIGLITLALGVSMICDMQHVIVVIISLIVGTLIGTWWNIDKQIEKLGEWLKSKLRIGNQRFTEGLVSAFLLFCVGSMTILGAIQEGIGVSRDLIFTKSILDFCSSIIFASVFGIGVVFSIIPLFLLQGSLTLFAAGASDFFSPAIIGGITATGGVMLLALGLDILEIKKISVANMLPALMIVVLVMWLVEFFV